MGLLDSLYNSDNYGGQGGGLLDLLKQFQMQQQYQPSAGFPDQPPPQPQQAQPIAVGDYTMPRIGAAQDFAAQQPVATDISAQSRQPADQQMQAPQPTQPAFLQPPTQGGFGGAFRGMTANMSGGPLGMLMGGIGGAMGMGRGNPQDIAQQNLKAQYDALRQTLQANGDNPQVAASKAMIAVMNPKAAETILPELFTTKEKLTMVKDGFGGETPYWTNEREQTMKPAMGGGDGGAPPSSIGAISDNIAKAKAGGATREQLLQQVPSAYRSYVDSVLQDKALPANMGRGAARMAVMGLAHAVDGNFNEEMIPTRIAMRKDFSGEGKNGQSIGSFNTAQHHIDKLSDDLEKVAKFQGNYPTINAIRSYAANNTNSNPELRDAVQSLNTDMAAVSHEIGTAYNAGHLSDHDMATWNALTSSNLPPDQLRRGISDFVDLLNGKRDALNHMYRQTFGEDAPTIEKERNDAVTTKVHQRSPQYGTNQTVSTPASSVPAAPKPGTTQGGYRFRGGNPADKNNWEQVS